MGKGFFVAGLESLFGFSYAISFVRLLLIKKKIVLQNKKEMNLFMGNGYRLDL